jgi:NADH-quinone oxidoreductase subunit L
MLVLVALVSFLVQVYSLGYLSDESMPSLGRYYAYQSLFAFSMMGLVLAPNFVQLFICWELVGLCSYLLIGHWFDRDRAADAAKKAFLTNRVGDFGFMVGILMVWMSTGSIVFKQIAGDMSKITVNPGYLAIAVLLIFCGAAAKSAQFPLHVWLPDAMEGPTPVSALIHAATMVAAGVYMLVRVAFIVQASPDALQVIAWIGTITAVMAGLIATQQDDIKRILAYSTLSQLGYMVMAVGLASNEAAMFHLFTHAFFKALLFLGAGCVIVMLHHEQNIWKMGGLARNLPITFLTFAAGALALIGCPPFAGFFSKDAILALAYAHNTPIFVLALFTALLTAFYVTRLFVVVFLGKPRSAEARSSDEAPFIMTGPLVILAILSLVGGFSFFAQRFLVLPHEKEAVAIVPALAIAAILIGVGVAVILYRNRESEPLNATLLLRGFYIDEFYSWLIDSTQGSLARLAAFIDRWIIDAGAVRGGDDHGVPSRRQLHGHAQRHVLGGSTGARGAGLLLARDLGPVERDRDPHRAGAARHLAGQRDPFRGHAALVLRVGERHRERRRHGAVEGDGLEGEPVQIVAVGAHELLHGRGIPEGELEPPRLGRNRQEARLEHLHDAEGLEHAGGHAHVLVGVHFPGQADEALAELRVEALEGEPRDARLADLERPGEAGRRLELEQHLAGADDLGHAQVAGEVDLAAPVGREDVAAVLDPDQVVGAVAADPLVADRVGGPLGLRGLRPRGEPGEQHEEAGEGTRNAALTASYPRHGNSLFSTRPELETKPFCGGLSTNGS